MKRLIIAAVAALALACASHVPPPAVPAPPSADSVVMKSIVRVTQEIGDREASVCTGFSIGERKFLTAAHCVGPITDAFTGDAVPAVLKVDGVFGAATNVDVERDLAVILVDIVKPALPLREAPLQRFENVSGAGFGHGFRFPLVTDHTVMILSYDLDTDHIWPGTVFMHPFIGGMSGGPIYDSRAEVVGIVQRASEYIGYGVNVQTIQEFLSGALSPKREGIIIF